MPFQNCHYCGDEITPEQISQGDYRYCDSCGEYQCADCGTCTYCDDDNDDDYGDGRDTRVHYYDYRPSSWRPKGEYPMRALLGVELEVHNYNIARIPDVVSEFDRGESHLFVKEDGSLSSGLEIVSHPATLEWTRTYPWEDLLTRLREVDCSARDGYGLHVHVSRNAFRRQGRRSPTHQLTWLLFLHRNPRELELLARRSSEQWAKFAKPRSGELAAKAHAHDGYGGDRYVAVNCNNRRTYELRFFKSTVDPVEFHAAVEFADASVEYTRAIKTSDILRGQALSWPHFASWAEDHDYPNLTSEIETQATLSVTTPPEEVVNRRVVQVPRSRYSGVLGNIVEGYCDCPACARDRGRNNERPF